VADVGRCDVVVAVVGQPSTGKSTFFTYVTGEVVRIATWPGTTVEQRVARVDFEGRSLCLVDLPGIYGLTPSSPEERVTKRYLMAGGADVVLVLVDPLVIERSVYLPIQVAEMGGRVVVAITKWDLVHRAGVHIDVETLSRRLGVPVVPISSITGEGIRELLSTIVRVAEEGVESPRVRVDYGPLESYISRLLEVLSRVDTRGLPRRWVSLRLLEGDSEVRELVGDPEVLGYADTLREEFRRTFGRLPEDVAVFARYEYASEVLRGAVVRVRPGVGRVVEVLDRLYLDPLVGPPLSLLTLFAVFLVAFTVNTGFPLNVVLRYAELEEVAEVLETYSLSGLLHEAFSALGELVRSYLGEGWLTALVCDGVIGGLGTVLSFTPLVLVVSAAIAVLEDSGIGPRMVVSLHRFFSAFGLSGRSLYPLVVGFGCNVPAALQSRISIDEAERLEVLAAVPFIICQARLVVMTYFVQTLLPGRPLLQATLMLLLYVVSVALYLLTAKLVRRALRVREPPELVMEVPPLHRPSPRVVWWNSWLRTRHFLAKAGVLIFLLSLLSWASVALGPSGPVGDPSESYAAVMGSGIGRVLTYLYGVSEESAWKVGFALIYGTVAKEGLVTSVAQLSAVEEREAIEALGLTAPQTVSLLVFFMFYIPCIPTIAVVYQESRSLRFTLAVVAYQVTVALTLSTLSYPLLSLLV
jgi:ferrous iron transport protein B